MFTLRSRTEEGLSMAGTEDKSDIAEPDAADPKAGDGSVPIDVQQKSDIAESDRTDPKAADGDGDDDDESGAVDVQQRASKANVRRISVSVRTLLVATLIAALLASVGVLTWLYLGAKAKLDDEARQAANNSHAERIALDYAVDAAKINFQDLDTWKKSLVKGTTPELKEKLNSAATSMEQILAPLQWNSTAIPLVAKVRSNLNGIYVVDTFVGVETKTMQAPDGLQSTATYSVTIDKNHDWQISDVGGIGAVVGQK
jgi:Mce-associated membrane protein